MRTKRNFLPKKKYNMLHPIREVIRKNNDAPSKRFWEFLCECGGKKIIRLDQVTRGIAKSCGCLQKAFATSGNARRTHGYSKTRLYRIWVAMIHRTKGKITKNNKSYRLKNIIVSTRWQKFEQFRKDMNRSYLTHIKKYGERNTTIDRIDNDGNYTKENCRWATYKLQMNNRSKKYESR